MRKTLAVLLPASTFALTACAGAKTADISHWAAFSACKEAAQDSTVRMIPVKRVDYPRPEDNSFTDASEDGKPKIRMNGTVVAENENGYEFEFNYRCTAYEASYGITAIVSDVIIG